MSKLLAAMVIAAQVFIAVFYLVSIGFVIATMCMIFLSVALADVGNHDRAAIEQLVTTEALEVGIDPTLALAIMEVESGGNPKAIGKLGEVGLFQLRPNLHDARPGDTRHNVRIALRYLAYTRDRCTRDYGDAFFVCFNHGPFKRVRSPRETAYYKKVKAAYRNLLEARR